MSNVRKNSLSLIFVLLVVLVAVGAGAGIVRMINGLGTTTSLSDGYPWGLWIVYDIFFVPFSAGAFMILAITHIYGKKEYHDIARPVVVAGFLGEIMVVVILLMDLGRWHQFYNILLPWYWNINSFMFQVSICLTIYIGVMVLEVAPAILERLNWQKPLRLIRMATILIAGLGIVLSSLHQSSLGALFLLIPYRLHHLWWTPTLPLLFFASAVFAGLAMVIFVVTLTFRAFHRRLDLALMSNLARVVAVLLGIYFVLKLGDLVLNGEMGLLFSSGWLSVLFLAEIVVGVIVPIILFGIQKVRNTSSGLIAGSACALAGVALNRTNVAIFAYAAPDGAVYFPHWMEILVSVAAIAAGVLLFVLAVRFLPILPEEEDRRSLAMPQFSRWAVVFGGGALALLTITMVLLLQPSTQAKAVRTQATVTTDVSASPREGQQCQACHGDEQALLDAGMDPNEADLYVVAPLPAEAVHADIRCVACHYGDTYARDVEVAHVGTVTDPTEGDAQICVACHPEIREEFPEDRLRTPHNEVIHGDVADVSCSDCHGAVGHGFDPVSGQTICPMGVCLDCHQERNLDSELSECDACHVGAHDPVLGYECSTCHQSTEAWQAVDMISHPVELVGGHAQAACSGCHPNGDFEQAVNTECADCHEAPGDSHYGADCQECHTPASFSDARMPDHPVKLEGYHESASCEGCHADGETSPEYLCSNCHERPENHLIGECSICHTPQGWVGSISFVVDLTPPIPHDIEGREACLACHDPASEVIPAPSNHGNYINEQCGLCHK
ncbi:MAG: Ni/Fe-hydrogenase cytochrome b subunit [Anaerolineae bacterium]|jgi:Ni/Fe-hydrogenase subunit HybB-like protein